MPPIEVPDSKIAGFQITKEQQNTLIQLVKINHCSIDSLRPIFKKKEYNKSYVMIKKWNKGGSKNESKENTNENLCGYQRTTS